jgi:hypothetical protein
MFALGIGDEPQTAQLNQISGDPNRTLQIKSFDDLTEDVRRQLLGKQRCRTVTSS